MARQPKLKDIIGYSSSELAKLTKAEFQKLVNKVINRVNRRLSAIEKAGLEFSPAYSTHPNKISKKGIKKMTRKELQNKLTESTAFLKDPTSSVRGARKHIESLQQQMNKAEKESFKRKVEFGAKWGRIVSRLQELFPNYAPSEIKDIVEEISQNDENILGMSEDEATYYIMQQIGSGYERVQKEHKWKPSNKRNKTTSRKSKLHQGILN